MPELEIENARQASATPSKCERIRTVAEDGTGTNCLHQTLSANRSGTMCQLLLFSTVTVYIVPDRFSCHVGPKAIQYSVGIGKISYSSLLG